MRWPILSGLALLTKPQNESARLRSTMSRCERRNLKMQTIGTRICYITAMAVTPLTAMSTEPVAAEEKAPPSTEATLQRTGSRCITRCTVLLTARIRRWFCFTAAGQRSIPRLGRSCRPWQGPGRSSPSSNRDTGARPTSPIAVQLRAVGGPHRGAHGSP